MNINRAQRVGGRCRRGSAMVEFALIVPVIAAVFVASFSIAMSGARALQAGSVSRIVGSLAASGVDPTVGAAKDQVREAARGLGVETGHTAIFITEISRDASGYRVLRQHTIGNATRWKSSVSTAEGFVELEPGERAWITEVLTDGQSFSGIGPAELRVRNVF